MGRVSCQARPSPETILMPSWACLSGFPRPADSSLGLTGVLSSRGQAQADAEAECGDLGPAAAAPGAGESCAGPGWG